MFLTADPKIVYDRFHVMKHMLEAVDSVRKWEHRRLHAEGDETLARTKYLWLYSELHFPRKHEDCDNWVRRRQWRLFGADRCVTQQRQTRIPEGNRPAP